MRKIVENQLSINLTGSTGLRVADPNSLSKTSLVYCTTPRTSSSCSCSAACRNLRCGQGIAKYWCQRGYWRLSDAIGLGRLGSVESLDVSGALWWHRVHFLLLDGWEIVLHSCSYTRAVTTGLNFTCKVEDCMGSGWIWLSLWLEQSEATRLQVATRSQMIQMQCQISATPTESSQSSQELAVSVGTGPGVRASARCMSGCSPDMYQTTWCDSLCRCHCEATRILLHTISIKSQWIQQKCCTFQAKTPT